MTSDEINREMAALFAKTHDGMPLKEALALMQEHAPNVVRNMKPYRKDRALNKPKLKASK